MMISRRLLLAGAGSVAVLAGLRWLQGSNVEAATSFEIEKSDADWRRILTRAQYNVRRRQGTANPYLRALTHKNRKGVFACAGCDLPLFSSETKFESGTGWPSFY